MADKKSPAPKKKPAEVDPDDPDTNPEGGDGDPDDPDVRAAEENNRINAIVTSRVKREMKAVNATLLAIQESIKGLTPNKQAPADGDDPDDPEETPAKKAADDSKTNKRMTRLEKELAEARDAQKKSEAARAEQEAKTQRAEMRGMFQAALSEHGVTDPRLMRAALDQLEQDGLMFRDEDGKVKFKGVDKYGIDTNFDPKTGLKTWVQSEGKSFVPAVEAGGSGTGGARGGAQTPSASMSKGEFGKLSPAQKAAIEIDRASQGLPPLE